ncbi:MAG: hypothetical protein QXS54_05220 [Candidatus Methanomethylicaceae archaeon]
MKLERIFHALALSYKMRVEGLETATLHLIGPPGIGKSAAVRDFAKTLAAELNKKFVDFDDLSPDEVESILKSPDQYFIFADKRLTGLDPVDVSGIPRPVNGSKYIMFLPLALAQLLNKCAGILFLDEFLNESRSNMLAQAYKIVRDYKIGDISLSKSSLVVAASNSSEHSSIVGSMQIIGGKWPGGEGRLPYDIYKRAKDVLTEATKKQWEHDSQGGNVCLASIGADIVFQELRKAGFKAVVVSDDASRCCG